MIPIRFLLPAFTLLAALWAARIVNPSELDARYERWESWLKRVGPLAAALISAALVWWTWGAWHPLPVVHDEGSYVLQAEIFARFRWTVPTPAVPEFYEQPHVRLGGHHATSHAACTHNSHRRRRDVGRGARAQAAALAGSRPGRAGGRAAAAAAAAMERSHHR